MNNLRPTKLDEIIGQEEIKEILKIRINSAKQRNDVLSSVCLSGNSGYGKTTFAQCIANEINVKFHYVNGAAIISIKNILPYLLRIKRGEILFIDEIHSLKRKIQEFFYTILEDSFFILGKDKDITKINIPDFTFIGATTNFGDLNKPFRERIKIPLFFSCYTINDLAKLALLNSSKLNIEIEDNAAIELAKRCRNTPRTLNRLLEWCRDFIINTNSNAKKIVFNDVINAMKLAKIDKNGFTFWDRQYIILLQKVQKPLSLETISSMLKFDVNTVKDEIEPFLLEKNVISKTTKGRILNDSQILYKQKH